MERDRPEETSAPLPRPLGSYVLLKSLGRGGMGSVFLALQRLEIFERLCVIKLIRQRLVNHERHRTRFLDEARTTLSLSHRNVSRVLDVGVEDGAIYLAMEYVAGRDVRSVLKRCSERNERIPASIGVFVLAELLEALEAAHTHVDAVSGKPAPIVHRDVSPHNAIIGFDGGVKLIDFGVASSAVATSQTDPGLVLGKTAYMSPEQAEGKPVDGRADVFSAAILGVELLGGVRFYGEMAIDEIGAALETAQHRPPSFASLPDGVRPLLDHALAFDPKERPSAGELAAKLRAWAHASGQLADAADVRAFLAERFPNEESAERELHQDLLKLARGELAGIDATLTASRAAALAPPGADVPTESRDHSTPTSLERRRGALPSLMARPKETSLVTHTRMRRARLVPAVAVAILAFVVLIALVVMGPGGLLGERSRGEAPRSAEANAAYRAGMVHRRALELRAARERFEEAARLEPGHALTQVRLAQTLFAASQVVDARVVAERAADLGASLPEDARDLVVAVEAEAARDWDRALSALARRAQGPHGTLEDWLELARAQIAAGRAAPALETLARARQHADAPSALSLLLILESRAASSLGDRDRALLAARAARAEAKGADALTAYARYCEGVSLVGFVSGPEVRAVLEDAHERFKTLRDDGGRAATLLAISAIDDDGRPYEARVATLEEALALFRAVRDREGEALALNNLASISETHRDIDTHIQLLKQALVISREVKDVAAIATTALNLAIALGFEGEIAAGHAYALESVTAAREGLDAADLVDALSTLGELELLRGNTGAARAAVDEALGLLSDASTPSARAFTRVVDAELRFAQGDVAQAARAFDEVAQADAVDVSSWAVTGAARVRVWEGRALEPRALKQLHVLLEEEDVPTQLDIRVILGTALLQAGDAHGAAAQLAAARALLSMRPHQTLRTHVDALEARVLAKRGDREGALRLARRAAAEARKLGALAAALEHELVVAELGDASGLAGTRAEAERAGLLVFAARAAELQERAGRAR
jgi:serine/threonine protein kinase